MNNEEERQNLHNEEQQPLTRAKRLRRCRRRKMTDEEKQAMQEKQKRDKERIAAMLADENFPYRRGNIVWYEAPEALKTCTHAQSGLRRGLIFSNDVNNLFSDLIYVIPCTTKWKRMKLHVRHGRQFILAEQLNPVDKSWIYTEKEIEKIDSETMAQVELNFMKQFGLISLNAKELPEELRRRHTSVARK